MSTSSNITRLIEDLGRARAEGAAQQGQIWGNAVNNVAQVPGQIATANRAAQDEALRQRLTQNQIAVGDQQIAAGAQQAKDTATVDRLWADPGVYNADGTINRQGLQSRLKDAGHLLPAVMEHADKLDASSLDLRQKSQALYSAQQSTLANERARIEANGNDPGMFALSVATLSRPDVGIIPKQQADQWVNAQTPEQVASVLKTWPQPKREYKEVGPEGKLYDVTGGQPPRLIASGGEKPPTAEGMQYTSYLGSLGLPASTKVEDLSAPQRAGFEAFKHSQEPITVKTMVNGQPVERVMTQQEALRTGQFPSQPPASVQVNAVTNDALSKLPGWVSDASRPTKGDPESNRFDPSVKMTPNGLYQGAINFIMNGQYPPTGRGNDTAAQVSRAAINAKVGAIAADAGLDVPTLRAVYKANEKSLNQAQSMYDAAASFIATADKNAPLLEASLSKIPDSGIPLLNSPYRTAASKLAGSPGMSEFNTYLQSVRNEYAKIITQPNMAAQLTDSARKEAETLLSPDATVQQMITSMRALKAEGDNRLVSIGQQIQKIQGRIQGGSAGTGTPPATSATPAPATAAAAPALGTEGTVNGKAAVWRQGAQGLGWYAK